MSIVERFDVSEIGKPIRTPQGFLRVPASLTRAGVFEYRRQDGTVVRELRHPDEVFKADSLATLAAAPVTELHPPEMITPKNVRKHSIGHVSESVKRDGNLVAGDVTVEADETIGKVEKRDLRELSCGYRCRIDATPGEWNGQRYDAVQRDIVYNHVALGPKNWGRAGSDVALRLDSNGAVNVATGDLQLVTIKVAGKEVQVTPEAAAAITAAEVDALKKRASLLFGAGLKFDPQIDTPRGVKELILKHAHPKTELGDKSDDYVDGLFDSTMAEVEREKGLRRDSLSVPASSLPWRQPLHTSADRFDGHRASAAADRNLAPWQQPLSATKDTTRVDGARAMPPRGRTHVLPWQQPLDATAEGLDS